MKTTLSKELENRSIYQNLTFNEIGEGGSLIPMVISDENTDEPVEVLFCESISGGQDEIDNMPRCLSLTKLIMIDGSLHTFSANYIYNTDLENINNNRIDVDEKNIYIICVTVSVIMGIIAFFNEKYENTFVMVIILYSILCIVLNISKTKK